MQGYSGYAYEDDVYNGREDLTVPCTVNCCGYLKTDGIDVSLARCRKDFYLVYLINGVGHYRQGDTTVAADAGSTILYRPGEKQDYYYLGNENAEFYWIHFTGSAVQQLLKGLYFKNNNISKTGMDSDCISIFESIINELQLKRPDFHTLCAGYLIQLLASLSRKAALLETEGRALKSKYMDIVIKKMHKDYSQNYDMNFYARLCNLSVFYFMRSFKRVTGVSPNRYIEKIKMNKAKELLVNTTLSITEISSMLGYSDAFYFSKVFKKNTGITPTNFRKSQENGIGP